MILGITGLARSGKEAAAQFFIQKGFTKVNISDFLKEELINQGKEPTKANMSLLGDELRKKYGKDIMIKLLLNKIKGKGNIVITGVRSPEELSYLKKEIGEFKLIAITASKEVRFQRRNEEDSNIPEEFFARDERDIKNKGLDKVLTAADITIENNTTVGFLYQQLEKYLGNFKYER